MHNEDATEIIDLFGDSSAVVQNMENTVSSSAAETASEFDSEKQSDSE